MTGILSFQYKDTNPSISGKKFCKKININFCITKFLVLSSKINGELVGF